MRSLLRSMATDPEKNKWSDDGDFFYSFWKLDGGYDFTANSLGIYLEAVTDVACEIAKKMNINIQHGQYSDTIPGYRELIFTGLGSTDLSDFWDAVDAECDARGIQRK